MLTDLVKLRRRRRRPSKRGAPKPMEIKESAPRNGKAGNSVICDREYLKNKDISILTDKEPELYLAKDTRFLKKGTKGATETSNRLHTQDSSSLDVTVGDKKPVVPQPRRENVDHGDTTRSVKVKRVSRKYCGCKCSGAWYLKFRRQVLKSLRNKIWPGVVIGPALPNTIHLAIDDAVLTIIDAFRLYSIDSIGYFGVTVVD